MSSSHHLQNTINFQSESLITVNLDKQTYIVLLNEEDQYSLWPFHKEIPSGWRTTGHQGTKQECINYVENLWLDITPKSINRS